MEDPIGGHPTRAQQLDVLVSIIEATAEPGDVILDLGCGTGYLAHLLFAKRSDGSSHCTFASPTHFFIRAWKVRVEQCGTAGSM